MKQPLLRVRPLVLAVSSVLVLAGCGSDGGGGSSTKATSEGTVISSYVKGARVFCDLNANGTLDEGEISVLSERSGRFQFAEACPGNVVAQGIEGSEEFLDETAADTDGDGQDDSSVGSFSETLIAPPGLATVSPLTTVISALIDNGMNAEDAEKNLAASLGLPGTKLDTDFNKNPDILATSEAVKVLIDSGISVANIASIVTNTAINIIEGGKISLTALETVGVDPNIAASIQKVADSVIAVVKTGDKKLLLSTLETANNFTRAIKTSDTEVLAGLDQFANDINLIATATKPLAISSAISVKRGDSVTGQLAGYDPDKTALKFEEVDDNTHVTIQPSGRFTYTAELMTTAKSDSFQFAVRNANDVVSDTTTVNVKIINSLPTAIGASFDVLSEGTVTGQLTGTDRDSTSALTFAPVGTLEGLTLNANGSFTYTAGIVTAQTAITFQFTVTDQDGGVSAPATVTLNVLPAGTNVAPKAITPEPFSVQSGQSITGQVSGTDLNTGDILTFAQVGALAGLTLNADGTFTYTASSVDTDTTVTFQFTVSDGQLTSDPATVTINVTAVGINHAPTAFPTSIYVSSGRTTTGNVRGTDPDPGDSLTYSLVAELSGLTFNPDGTFTYTAQTVDTATTVTFQFTVSDGKLTSNPATVTINISAPIANRPPVANPATFAVESGKSITRQLTGTDLDGDTLSFALVGSLPGLILNSDGSFTYTAPSGIMSNTTKTFRFTVADAEFTSDSTTVTITIRPAAIVNQPPVASNATFDAGSEMTITGILSGSDPEGDAITFTEFGDNSNAQIKSDGSFTYTATAISDEMFPDTFSFKVQDAKGLESSEAKVTINTYPYFNMSNVSVNSGAGVSLTDFSNSGLATGKAAIDTLGFKLLEKGMPLGTAAEKTVQVAMKIKNGEEELSVALDNVVLYHDESSALAIKYPLNATMYGYYKNNTQTASVTKTNGKEDNLKTTLDVSGADSGFSKLTIQLKKMRAQFDQVFDSPFMDGTATGTYTATFVINGVKFGSTDASNIGSLLGNKTLSVLNPATGGTFTVTGTGINGTINFP